MMARHMDGIWIGIWIGVGGPGAESYDIEYRLYICYKSFTNFLPFSFHFQPSREQDSVIKTASTSTSSSTLHTPFDSAHWSKIEPSNQGESQCDTSFQQ
jgi:hypothetical protein